MQAKPRLRPLTIGEPAPWFARPTGRRARFAFDTVAGRYIVLAFLGSASAPQAQALLAGIRSIRPRFDDVTFMFFGVSTDPADFEHPALEDSLPGIRFFRDLDRSVSALYGAVAADGANLSLTYVLDPSLRVLAVLSPAESDHFESLTRLLDRLPALPAPRRAGAHAPVLVVPRIFEPGLCRELVAYYERLGGLDSGYMLEVDGRTKGVIDHGHKRRRDREIQDETLCRACMHRIHHRLAPEIRKAFQFWPTRMERYIVSCYDAEEGGYFRPHRDNTTRGTAHRRFAVSLFLNSEEYEGGYLRFPEFGNALYSAPAGGAVVFACSLLHEATPVTRGRRYMFLPFLYDAAAAQLRAENLQYLDADGGIEQDLTREDDAGPGSG
jgi:predicted 2-oxoglutarate/Fe(II)-dependent dioxygenase YbiX/peroxiredoxin